MNNRKFEQELKEAARKSAPIDCLDDDSLEIVVLDDPKPALPKIPTKEDALGFWVNRIKHKNAEKCIVVDQPSASTTAFNSKKIMTPAIKATIPIVTHQK